MQPYTSWPDAAPDPQPDRPSRGRPILLVFAASLLSAVIASAGTGVVLIATAPRTVASAPIANPASTTSQATVDSTGTSNTIEAVAAQASPAVVTITSSSSGSPGSRFDPFSIPQTGVGSGFIYGSDGRILTNNHVVEGAQTLTVTLKDGTDVPARVLATDPEHDLAIVKIDKTGLPTIALGDSDALQVGQLLVAIGSPLGQFTDSVTSGILSATGRSIDVRDAETGAARHLTGLLQTDAAINPGNSGGPLLNSAGEAVGINTAMASSAEGIGFAIPIHAAKALVAEVGSST